MFSNFPSSKKILFDIQHFADGEWITTDDSVSYQQTVDGAKTTLFTIDGLNSSENITLDADKKMVTVAETALANRVKDTITIDNGYTLSLGGEIGESLTEPTGETQTLTTDGVTIDTDGVYQFAEDFSGTVTISATNVKLIGASSQLSNAYIKVTAENAKLWIQDLNISSTSKYSTGYNIIKFGSGTDNYLVVKGTNNLGITRNADISEEARSAAVNIGGGLNILGDGSLTATNIGYYGAAAIGSDFNEDLSSANIYIGGSVTITATAGEGAGIGTGEGGKVGTINIGGQATVTTTSILGAGIGSGQKGTTGDINIGGNAQVTGTSKSSDDKVSYGAGIGSGRNGTAGNINIGGNAQVTGTSASYDGIGSGNNGKVGTISVYTNATATSNGTIMSATSDENVDPTATDATTEIAGTIGGAGWYSDTATKNVTFNLEGENDYFTLESSKKQITYHDATLGTAQVELSGVENYATLGNPTVDGAVTLGAENFSDNVNVVNNSANYAFNLSSGDYGNKTFSGLDTADTITNNGSNLTISGGDGNDSISNSGANVTINGGDGADTITNSGENVSINGGDGADTISNSGDNVTITGGADADYISNTGANVTIDGGVGNDTITNSGESVLINASAGAESISNSGKNVTIYGGVDDDTISFGDEHSNTAIKYDSGDGNDFISTGFNTTDSLIIDDGTGLYFTETLDNDIIVNALDSGLITIEGAANLSTLNIYGESVAAWATVNNDTIYSNQTVASGTDNADEITVTLIADDTTAHFVDGGAGNDTITNYGENLTISGGADNDYISNDGANVSIDGGDGDDTIANSGENILIDAGAGDDSISNSGNQVTINGGADNDYISNDGGANVSINGGDGDDTIANSGENILIDAGAGDDSISNSGNQVTIDSGEGNNYISNSGSNVTITGGTGNDSIFNSGGDNVSIDGGEGNDAVTLESSNAVINYNAAEGNDTIFGFGATATLSIAEGVGTYATTTSGDDIAVSVFGGGSVLLKDAANLSAVKINGVYLAREDTNGNILENPVAKYNLDGVDYYTNTVAEATNNAANSATVTVIASSTETSTLNLTKNLTIQFESNDLGVYNVNGGNFVSADTSSAAQFTLDKDRVISNANSLLINSGATATLDGYAITGTDNGYSFALQENSFTLNDISYSGAGTATFNTSGNVSLISGAVASGTNNVTSSTGINIATGNYTVNGVEFSVAAANTAFTTSDGVKFNLSSNTVTHNSMTFTGSGTAIINSDAQITLTKGAVASNVAAGQAFTFSESGTYKINDKTIVSSATSLSVTNTENGLTIGDKTFSVTGDSAYTVNVDSDGNIVSAVGIDGGANIIDAGGAASILTNSAGNFTFAQDENKTFAISGDDSITFGLTSVGAVQSIAELEGTVSGNFADGVTVDGGKMPVSISGDSSVNVIANSNGVQTISGISNGASVQSAGGATLASTDAEGKFSFRSENIQNFTITGDSSVDFVLQNYNDANGKPTMQVAGVTNLENGTLIIDDKSAYLKINSTNAQDELSMAFTDTATFVIADSKVVSVDGINSSINNLKNDVTVHATNAITVNKVYADVKNDSDYNVVVENSVTAGLENISNGASVSVANIFATTDNNGEFTFATDIFVVNDENNSVTFLTDSNGAVRNVTNFAGTLKTSARSVTINGANFTTSNTDASIISAGVGISRVTGLVSGDSISGALDTTTVVMPSDGTLTINEREYILSGDLNGVEITGKRIDGLDSNASLRIGAAGTYTVNGASLAAKIGDTIIGTAEGAAYIYNPKNVPLDNNTMTEDEIAEQAGISDVSGRYSLEETDTTKTEVRLETGGNALNGNLKLVLDNPDSLVAQTADFRESTGIKRVTLEGGEQNVIFNDGGGNIAIIGADAKGAKNIQLGDGGDLVIVNGNDAQVNISAGNGKSTIVTAGDNVKIDVGRGATKIVPNGGNINLSNYDASTGAGIQVNDAADLTRAIANGNINLEQNAVTFGNSRVNFNGGEDSTTVNLFNNQGVGQKIAYTNTDGGEIDSSGERESLLLVGNADGTKYASRLMAGSGNDTAIGGAGDYFDLGAGNNYVSLVERGENEDGATVALTSDYTKTDVDGFKFGYSESSDRARFDVSGARVSYSGGRVTFTSNDGGKLILNLGLGSSADLIDDDNFIGGSTIDEITPITYEQGEYQFVTAQDSLSSNLQLTFAQ